MTVSWCSKTCSFFHREGGVGVNTHTGCGCLGVCQGQKEADCASAAKTLLGFSIKEEDL